MIDCEKQRQTPGLRSERSIMLQPEQDYVKSKDTQTTGLSSQHCSSHMLQPEDDFYEKQRQTTGLPSECFSNHSLQPEDEYRE